MNLGGVGDLALLGGVGDLGVGVGDFAAWGGVGDLTDGAGVGVFTDGAGVWGFEEGGAEDLGAVVGLAICPNLGSWISSPSLYTLTVISTNSPPYLFRTLMLYLPESSTVTDLMVRLANLPLSKVIWLWSSDTTSCSFLNQVTSGLGSPHTVHVKFRVWKVERSERCIVRAACDIFCLLETLLRTQMMKQTQNVIEFFKPGISFTFRLKYRPAKYYLVLHNRDDVWQSTHYSATVYRGREETF